MSGAAMLSNDFVSRTDFAQRVALFDWQQITIALDGLGHASTVHSGQRHTLGIIFHDAA